MFYGEEGDYAGTSEVTFAHCHLARLFARRTWQVFEGTSNTAIICQFLYHSKGCKGFLVPFLFLQAIFHAYCIEVNLSKNFPDRLLTF